MLSLYTNRQVGSREREYGAGVKPGRAGYLLPAGSVPSFKTVKDSKADL